METILRTVFVVFVAVSGLMMNMNLSYQAQTLHYAKEDLELAVHDATLEVNETEMANGRVVFDQARALTTFRNSFERNSRLSASEYEIVEMTYLDDVTSSFPYTYTSANGVVEDVFLAPTIIAFIRVKSDAYYTKSSTKSFTQMASYSYRINNLEPSLSAIAEPESTGFVWPVPYTRNVTSPFGIRVHPTTGDYTFHRGIDVAGGDVNGKPVVSAKAGRVTYAGVLSTYGILVIVDHGGGLETRYAHLSGLATSVGANVSAGQVVGYVGSTGRSTGPHLHYEVRVDGVAHDPMIFYP